MTGKNDHHERRELLAHLRHGVRTSSRLAEQLVNDPQVGAEATTLLKRLRAVGQEIELVEILRPELRSSDKGPIWRKPGANRS